jgi:hypothetical protein
VKNFRYFAPELVYLLRLRESQPGETPAFEKEIQDDQLRMMFSCCHPDFQPKAQVTLILKTLCGFSVSEIARPPGQPGFHRKGWAGPGSFPAFEDLRGNRQHLGNT